jgi:two-component system cell cycle sensor histidine kinase/response regulator CckA
VYLPQATAVETVGEAPTSETTRARAETETVLVVEDMDALRDLTQRLLQRQGYTVLVAANADEAFQLCLREMRLDVLLTDVVMPGASGPELTDRLIKLRPDLKVVYMSGYTDEVILHHGVLNPGIAFLHKPFTSEALGQKLRDVLGR